MKHFTAALFLLLCLSCRAVAQLYANEAIRSFPHVQYGFSLRGSVEFGDGYPMFKLAANAGAGTYVSPVLYPSYNIDVQLYHAGIGSRSRSAAKHRQVTIDVVHAFTLTAGIERMLLAKRLRELGGWNVPLYYFIDNTYPALRNPYRYSTSLGLNLFYTTDKGKVQRGWFSQRSGYINLHIGRFQAGYSNEGAFPFSTTGIGDRKDRYYTGGGHISYHLYDYRTVNLIELTFRKFSGYSDNVFEIADILDQSFVYYKDTAQQYYNKGYYSVNVASTKYGAGLMYKWYNNYLSDFQHRIHYVLDDPYHKSPYTDKHTLTGSYYFIQNHARIK